MSRRAPMRDKLDVLRESFPLSQRWHEVETFGEAVDIAGARFNLIGYAATDAGGVTITGSAVGGSDLDHERAWFELLERAAVVEAMESIAPVQLVDASGKPMERLARAQL